MHVVELDLHGDRNPAVLEEERRTRSLLLEDRRRDDSRGYTKEFAESIFKQTHGFSEYGFPESHAASFALLVYASCWIKRHHPAEFLAALLNSQPMGFYSEQLTPRAPTSRSS